MRGRPGRVLGDAGKVGVVPRPQVVDPEDGLVAADLADVDVAGGRGGGDHLGLVAEPGEGDGEVAVRHRAQHGHALAQPQVLAHAERVDGRGDCGARARLDGWKRISLA